MTSTQDGSLIPAAQIDDGDSLKKDGEKVGGEINTKVGDKEQVGIERPAGDESGQASGAGGAD